MQVQGIENAVYLMQAWPKSESPYYDEVTGGFHYHDLQGILEIATDYLDETTYYLTLVNGQMDVQVKRLDNYKLHQRAKFIPSSMVNDDWHELQGILARLAQEWRGLEALQKINLAPVWESLLAAIFTDASFGERPQRLPSFKRSPYALAQTIRGTLKKAKRLGEWEWREWSEAGVMAVRKLASVKALAIDFPYPDETAEAAVRNSECFKNEVLTWFDRQLSPHGMTLIAISPIDELQAFGLVPTATLAALTAALDTLCVHYLLAPRYSVLG